MLSRTFGVVAVLAMVLSCLPAGADNIGRRRRFYCFYSANYFGVRLAEYRNDDQEKQWWDDCQVVRIAGQIYDCRHRKKCTVGRGGSGSSERFVNLDDGDPECSGNYWCPASCQSCN